MWSRARIFASSRAAGLVLALAAALGYWWPAFAVPLALGPDDWPYFQHMWDVGWVAAVRFGELALWDPYQCGGVPMFADPQAQIYGPWFLLSFLLGTTLALKVGIVLHAAASLLAMSQYATEIHRLSRVASGLAALAFTGSGFFAWHISTGHTPFLPFFLLPLALVLYHRACVDRRATVGLALLLALMSFEGAVYPLPFCLLLLTFEALARSLRTRQLVESFLPLLVAGLGFSLLAGVRWIPSLVELARHPRPIADHDALSLSDLWRMLTVREHVGRVPGHKWPWHEYAAFLGIGMVGLAALGGVSALARRRGHAVLGALLFVLLACGQLGSASPWALLHQLPVFDSLRVPSRFIVVGLLFLVLLAGLGLDELAQLATRAARAPWAGQLLSVALSLGCAADIFLVTRPIVDRWRSAPLPELSRGVAFEQRPKASFKADFAATPRLGQGTLGCYTVLDYVPAPSLQEGPVAQAEVIWGDALLSQPRTTVNGVRLDVVASQPSTLIINQNFAPDFRSNVGSVYSDEGRLAVELPAGTYRLRVRYWPSTLVVGLLTTLLGVALTLAYWLWARRASTGAAERAPGAMPA